MYLARKHTEESLADIGKAFNRDHSTVLHSIKVVSNLIVRDGSVGAQLELLFDAQPLDLEKALDELDAHAEILGPMVAEVGPALRRHRDDGEAVLFEGAQGTFLDVEHNVITRTGLHCAPQVHEGIGTFEDHGTVRFSPGVFTTDEEIERAIDAVAEVAEYGRARSSAPSVAVST